MASIQFNFTELKMYIWKLLVPMTNLLHLI